MSPAQGRPQLYREACLLEEDEEESEFDWIDEDGDDEEKDEQAHGHTLNVAVNVPDEGRSLVLSCEINPGRHKISQMSVFLSGLLLMALTMLWLAFI